MTTRLRLRISTFSSSPSAEGAVQRADEVRPGKLAEPHVILQLLEQLAEGPLDRIVGGIQQDLVAAGEDAHAEEILEIFRLVSFAPQISGRIVSSLTTTVSGFSIQLPGLIVVENS